MHQRARSKLLHSQKTDHTMCRYSPNMLKLCLYTLHYLQIKITKRLYDRPNGAA